MKPSQTPIYRITERLMKWLVPIVASLPKSLPYQTLGGLVIRDIRECLDAIILAVQSDDASQRLGCIDVLIARMTAIKTTMRAFVELKTLSPRQEAQFLDLTNKISAQAGAWHNKTRGKVATS